MTQKDYYLQIMKVAQETNHKDLAEWIDKWLERYEFRNDCDRFLDELRKRGKQND